jgi:hypothetical protein
MTSEVYGTKSYKCQLLPIINTLIFYELQKISFSIFDAYVSLAYGVGRNLKELPYIIISYRKCQFNWTNI